MHAWSRKNETLSHDGFDHEMLPRQDNAVMVTHALICRRCPTVVHVSIEYCLIQYNNVIHHDTCLDTFCGRNWMMVLPHLHLGSNDNLQLKPTKNITPHPNPLQVLPKPSVLHPPTSALPSLYLDRSPHPKRLSLPAKRQHRPPNDHHPRRPLLANTVHPLNVDNNVLWSGIEESQSAYARGTLVLHTGIFFGRRQCAYNLNKTSDVHEDYESPAAVVSWQLDDFAFPLHMTNDPETPRWVTGMPANVGPASAELMPGWRAVRSRTNKSTRFPLPHGRISLF